MAEVTKASNPSPCTPTPSSESHTDATAVGEDIAAGDACYLHTDGKIYRSNGASGGVLGNSAEVDGFAPQAALVAQRQTLSLYHDVDFWYGSGLTPGTFLYLSTTVLGGLTTVVGAKQIVPVARVQKDGKRIRVLRTYAG